MTEQPERSDKQEKANGATEGGGSSGDERDELVKEIEEDPAQNPEDETLRDIKGG